MSDAFTTITSFPPNKAQSLSPAAYDTAANNYLKALDRLPAAAWTTSVDEKSLIEVLDPAVNSIPYLKLLCDSFPTVNKQGKDRVELLMDHVGVFFASFDPVQMRYVGTLWRTLWDWYQRAAQSLNVYDLTVLSAALLRLDPSAATFTTLHLRFVKHCLSIEMPSQALLILDQNIFAFPQALPKNVPAESLGGEHVLSNTFITLNSGFSEKIVPELVLEYYLLGAHVYIGTRNYQRARLYLEHVILYPTQQHGTSALQTEAYKKWILVGLLSQGKPFAYPKTVDSAVWKALKTMGKAYDALAESFEKRDWRKYQAELDAGTQIWANDGNLQLVAEAGQALIRYRVSDLEKTFAALPVSRVATHLDLSVQETHVTLTQMIGQSSLNATLVQGATAGEAILRFATGSATSQQPDLEAQTKRIEKLVAAVRDADCRLQLTKEHVNIAKRTKNAVAPDAEMADHMDLSWDAPGNASQVPYLVNDDDEDDAEEDIMS